MAVGGRGQQRARILRMGWLTTAVLVVLAVLFAVSGHWILTIVTALLAAAAGWVVTQMRAVR
jgi:hypothetical protein